MHFINYIQPGFHSVLNILCNQRSGMSEHETDFHLLHIGINSCKSGISGNETEFHVKHNPNYPADIIYDRTLPYVIFINNSLNVLARAFLQFQIFEPITFSL